MDDKNKILWQSVLEEIKKEVSKANFLALLKTTSILSLEADTAIISATSLMHADLLKKRFSNQIQQILEKHRGSKTNITFVVKTTTPTEKKTSSIGPLFQTEEKKGELVIGHLPRVRPDYTFGNFAVSPSNQLAFVSASTVAQKIGKAYNPFFLYGPVGVGKTHLMHAIANQAYQSDPSRKVIYITSEEFTNEVVEAIRHNDTARMKKKFRSASILLIDDVQFIEGKDKVQEELFHTFNILIDNQSQIVLSSDRPPHEIKKLEKRLSSRFAGGLTVDIGEPDFELKAAILLIKSKKYGHELPIEVAKLIAEMAQDTRSLEGLLLGVITQATTLNEPITSELALKTLKGVQEEKREGLHFEDIIKSVCSFYDIKPTQIRGPKRTALLVRARQVAMYLLKHELGITYVEIGNILGGRDHSTVMHGVEKMEKLLNNKAKIGEDILGITKQIRG